MSADGEQAGPGGAEEWDLIGDRAHSNRFPRIPDRDELSGEDLEDWDAFQVRYQRLLRDKGHLKYRHRIAGGFIGLMCSPPLARALMYSGQKINIRQGAPGSYTAADHEMIDLVLSFDAGHWGLMANHAPFAVASGIPVDTIEALRDGREYDLTEDERRVVAFVRASRDGTIDDDLWFDMVDYFGTDRGAADFVFFVMLLLTHVRLNQAFDEVQVEPDELQEILDALRAGTWPLPDVWHHGPEETRPRPAHPPVPANPRGDQE